MYAWSTSQKLSQTQLRLIKVNEMPQATGFPLFLKYEYTSTTSILAFFDGE